MAGRDRRSRSAVCLATHIAGVDLPSWVTTRSPGCSVSMARSPSGVTVLAPVAKQLKTCAPVGMYVAVLDPAAKGREVKRLLLTRSMLRQEERDSYF